MLSRAFANSVEDITCSTIQDCFPFSAICADTGKCECASVLEFELVEVDPPVDIGGTLYSSVCRKPNRKTLSI